MADYRSDKISGWQRAFGVQVNNPLGGIPIITFSEEVVIVNDGKKIILPSALASLSTDMTNPDSPILLLNPFDDSEIGYGTYGQIQVLLYSLYKQLAKERDEIA